VNGEEGPGETVFWQFEIQGSTEFMKEGKDGRHWGVRKKRSRPGSLMTTKKL